MLKFHLQIDWLLIAYSSDPIKTHSINISLQNQQGEQLTFERKIISTQQKIYQLDTLSPFQLYMIVAQNNHKYCPFRLHLISKLNPPIKRSIELQLSDLFDHYLNHQLFADIQPLQQLFFFEDGQITYRVTILEVETVTDTEEFSHLKHQLTKADSMQSEVKIIGSQLTTEDQMSKQGSTVQQRSAEESKLYCTDGEFKAPVSVKRLKSFQSMASMTFEELAKNVQLQAKKKKHQFERQREIYQTNLWYLKLGKRGNSADQENEEHSPWNFKIKILVILILLGLSLLIYSFRGSSNKEEIRNSRKKSKQEKNSHTKNSKANKKSSIKSK